MYHLPVLKGGWEGIGEGLFTGGCSDRTRGNGFKLKDSRFRLDLVRKLLTVRVMDDLEQVTQRSCGCPILGRIVGWGSEQLHLLKGVLVMAGVLE